MILIGTQKRRLSDANEILYRRPQFYDPTVGRFGTLDPFSGDQQSPQSLHKYSYCHGDGVNFTDPSGCDGLSLSNPAVLATVRHASVAIGQLPEGTLPLPGPRPQCWGLDPNNPNIFLTPGDTALKGDYQYYYKLGPTDGTDTQYKDGFTLSLQFKFSGEYRMADGFSWKNTGNPKTQPKISFVPNSGVIIFRYIEINIIDQLKIKEIGDFLGAANGMCTFKRKDRVLNGEWDQYSPEPANKLVTGVPYGLADIHTVLRVASQIKAGWNSMAIRCEPSYSGGMLSMVRLIVSLNGNEAIVYDVTQPTREVKTFAEMAKAGDYHVSLQAHHGSSVSFTNVQIDPLEP